VRQQRPDGDVHGQLAERGRGAGHPDRGQRAGHARPGADQHGGRERGHLPQHAGDVEQRGGQGAVPRLPADRAPTVATTGATR